MAELHRWNNRDGQEWACAAYDHGPFCRLCTKVDPADETMKIMLDAVGEGLVEAETAPDGELLFKISDEGNRYVENLIATNPEAAELDRRVEAYILDEKFRQS